MPWADNKENASVNIQVGGGVNEILADDVLVTILKTPGLTTLGLLLDADANERKIVTIKSEIG
jgi:hypothetical protein